MSRLAPDLSAYVPCGVFSHVSPIFTPSSALRKDDYRFSNEDVPVRNSFRTIYT